jgi:glycosyltransferase involved in cell wall biosynthesis
MKLIYIANIRIPTEKAHGLGRMKLCEAFSKQGIDVELICPFRFNQIKEDPFNYYGVSRNFKIKKIFHIDLIPLDRFLGPLASWISSLIFAFNILCYIWFKKYHSKDNIFFSHDHFPLFIISFFSSNVFYDVHDFPRLKTFLHTFYYSLLFKKLKGIIVTNSWKKEELKKIFKIEDEKILVCPNGVDIKEFDIKEAKEECRRKLNLPLDKKIIGYVGRLETLGKEKGIDILIKAFKILREKNDNIILCCVGGPKERIEEYQNFSKKINLKKEDVIFFDQVTHLKIPLYLKSFDVLVMPYPWTEHYAYYMSPLKLFEYMASKKPIVASDLPSIREVLNENNSILVKPDDPESLAEGIKKVLEDKNLAEKISNQAFQDVQQYTWEKRAKNILRFIQNIK